MAETSVSPIAVVSPAAPIPGGSSANEAVSQNANGQPTFSQVLQEKQSQKTDSSTASQAPESAPAQTSETRSSKGSETKGGKEAEDVSTRTPAELAQLMTTASLPADPALTALAKDAKSDASAGEDLSQTVTTDTAASTLAALIGAQHADKTASSTATIAGDAASNGGKALATPESNASSLTATLKADSSAAQSDARGQQDKSDRSAEQATALQLDSKTQRTGEQIGNQADASFANALERASQSSEAQRDAGAQAISNNSAASATQTRELPPAPQHAVATPVGRPGWAEEVGQRVLWTAKQDDSRAQLVLTPAQLGRIEVSINMNGDQATASFVAANAAAREALQDAMPKLRETLAQAGIQLGQADVSAGQSGQTGTPGERRPGSSGSAAMNLGFGSETVSSSSGWTRGGNGLVDTFA